jgi:hypothetical protein
LDPNTAARFLAKEEVVMLEQLFEMLAHPEEYEVCWHDGEVYLRPIPCEAASIKKEELVPEPA